MQKQKVSKLAWIKVVRQSSVAILLVMVMLSSVVFSTLVSADRFDAQISQLRTDNAAKQHQVNALLLQAKSLEEAINALQLQINVLQGQIDANNAHKADLEKQIDEAQKELEKQKSLLGQNIRSMYLEGEISTLEMLASSKDLSEFLDKQEYRNAVQDKIRTTLDKITQLKAQLSQQKTEVELLLQEQVELQKQVFSQKAEQDRLLNLNEGQRSEFNSQIRSNNAQITELRRQQIIENSRYNAGNMRGDPNEGGYPSVWMNAPMDTLVDNWGMYNRECVSWTAWKVASSGRHMPYWGGYGNANQWDDNARAMGMPVDGNPQAGDVAVSNAGYYGHVMYVEAVGEVNGRRAIYISQFNGDWTGHYSEGWRYTDGLVFIHFP